MFRLKPLARAILLQGLRDARDGLDYRGYSYQDWDIRFWARLAGVDPQHAADQLKALRVWHQTNKSHLRRRAYERIHYGVENPYDDTCFVTDCLSSIALASRAADVDRAQSQPAALTRAASSGDH